ncbi:MAG: tyrosine-type recombinase/integrase, partial [Lentisphaeria bacterium]
KAADIIRPHTADTEARRKAEVFNAMRTAQDELATLIDERRHRLAIADAWATFEKARNRPDSGPHTLRMYAFCWGRFTAWLASSAAEVVSLEDVTSDQAKAFANSLSGLTANRENKIFNTCRLVWRVLLPERPNPFGKEHVAPRRLRTEGHRELSADQLRLVCGKAQGEMRRLLAIGMYCGLRLADACQLDWGEIKPTPAGAIIIRTPSKTASRSDKAVRIPVHPDLLALLHETPPGERSGPVCPEFCAMYRLNTSYVTKRVREHFKDCGLETCEQVQGRGKAVSRLSFHSLRHSFVSLCAAAGVPLAVVQELAGHSSPAIQRHYLHISDATAAAGIAALPRLALPAGETMSEPVEGDRVALLSRFARLGEKAPLDQLRRAVKLLEEVTP